MASLPHKLKTADDMLGLAPGPAKVPTASGPAAPLNPPAFLRLVLALLLTSLPVLAQDKSGVGPTSISVPTGAGSLTGLGESFQPTLNTGTAHYGVGIKVPPGTAGQAPGLSLDYDGGNGNGPLGYGWQLSLPFVQRRTDQGLPSYGADVGFVHADTFISNAKEELVPMTNGYYFCKNEGAFIRYAQIGSHWEATLPDGTRLEFGLTDNGRIQDTNTSRVFSWLLEQEIDTHGNTINYAYNAFPGQQNQNQKYLTRVSYGPGSAPWSGFHFVTLVYQDRPDWFEDCRAGFPVRTGKRLAQILVGTQGPSLTGHLAGDFNQDGIPDYLDRSYQLNYLNYAGTNSFWSLLAGVQCFGADGATALPPRTFGYSVCNPPDLISAADQIIGGTNEPPFVMDNHLADLVDLNGDGLPDLLKTDAFSGQPTAYLNGGVINHGNGPQIQWSAPVPVGGDPQAWNMSLANTFNVVFLADMDGDGLADLVCESIAGQVFYFPNLGNVSWGAKRPMDNLDFPLPGPFANTNVRTADLDFDKRMDVIQSVSDGSGADYRIWFNLGNQQYSAGHTVPQTNGFMFEWPGVQIADFNGDRISDIAQIRPNGVAVTAGLGYGNFGPTIFVNLPDYTLTDVQITSARLVDITGDGLADLVVERAVPGELWYWINQGNYTFSTRKVVNHMPIGVGSKAVTRWADMNGNGTTDLIYADGTTLPRIQIVDLGQLLSGGQAPNLLVSVSNGVGQVTRFGYQSSTDFALADAAGGNPWPHALPFPVQVLASVTNSDTLGHQYVTQYQYHNGYYDAVEKQFRGFGRNETTIPGDSSAPGHLSQSFFDTGEVNQVMKGRLLGLVEKQLDGGVFSTSTNVYLSPPITLSTGTNGTNVSYTYSLASTNLVTELGQGTPRVLVSTFAYDNFGNQTVHTDYGVVTNGIPAAFNDERIITTQFALNTNAWILHLPARSQTMDLAGKVVSQTEFYYDDETFSANNPGQVTVGNLTTRLAWIDPLNPAARIMAARTKYDPFGNASVLLDPLAVAPGGAWDTTQGHGRQIAFDPVFHCYPVTETILVGGGHTPLVFQAEYDQGFGTAISETDFNANRTVYSYDVFGRPASVVRPGDTAALPTAAFSYGLGVPVGTTGLVNYVESRQLDKAPGTAGSNPRDYYLISRQYQDGLGRMLLGKQEAGSDVPGGPLRVVVSGAVLFNARQAPARMLNPFFTTLAGTNLDDLLAYESIESPGWSGQFEDNGVLVGLGLATAHQTSIAYDAQLRLVATTNADHTIRRTVFEPLLVRTFDENEADPASPNFNTPMVRYRDGLGRLRQVDESARLNDDGTTNNGVQIWSTLYQYDVNDRLTRVTDAQNNTRSMLYDGLSRPTFMNDWDRGMITNLYDAASNLIETVDAKGQRITYTYDGANRKLTEYDHDAGFPYSRNFVFDTSQPVSSTNRPQVAYFYDNPVAGLDLGNAGTGTASNTKGALAYVWDLSGEEHNSYDARQRLTYCVKRIQDPIHGQLASFMTSFGYDSASRVSTLTYPDNDAIGYQYNDRGLLSRISGGPGGSILSNLVYWPAGLSRQVNFGNGLQTTQTHDSRLRLSSLVTAPQNAPAAPVIAFAYGFDATANLKTITDQRPGSVVGDGDPRRNSQTFQYDDLYRLTGVQYSFTLPGSSAGNNGQISYRYDRVGNMLAQTSTLAQTDPLTGLPLANIGRMDSGGAGGRSNRAGRQPGDPPGPHALTQITPPAGSTNSSLRQFPYDANGNLTNLDGLLLTWDFRDRLVALEDARMSASYAYDFSGRRITKRITAKAANTNLPGLTTTYVGKHFEVRENDAPTKFVFAGEVRVARVTGTLSANTRVQRFRVSTGWNLLSLAVAAVNGGAQLNAGGATLKLYQWQSSITNWAVVNPAQTLAAGTVLWLQSSTNATISVAGAYPGPQPNTRAPPGATFLPGYGLEVLPLANQPSGLEFGVFGAESRSWQEQLIAPFRSLNGSPSVLAPGAALFTSATNSTDLLLPEVSLSFRYYHEDHLGSSAYVSDANGNLVEETAFFPFGAPRNSYQPRGISEPYQFSQKEQDAETDLDYFEARYLAAGLGRFLTVDPQQHNELPQQLGGYAYVGNRPTVFVDPTGEITEEHRKLGEERLAVLAANGGEEAHFARFKNGGGAYFIAQSAYDRFIKSGNDDLLIGHRDGERWSQNKSGPDPNKYVKGDFTENPNGEEYKTKGGLFITTVAETDKLIASVKHEADPTAAIAKALGVVIAPGDKFLRVKISKFSADNTFELANKFHNGSDPNLFVPGGFTIDNVPEAVVQNVRKGQLKEESIDQLIKKLPVRKHPKVETSKGFRSRN